MPEEITLFNNVFINNKTFTARCNLCHYNFQCSKTLTAQYAPHCAACNSPQQHRNTRKIIDSESLTFISEAPEWMVLNYALNCCEHAEFVY